MRTRIFPVLILLTGMAVCAIAIRGLNAQQKPEPVTLTPLLKTDNPSGLEGMEAHVTLVTIAPGAQSGRHYHLGADFMYILEGSGRLEIDGQSPVPLQQGQAYSTPARLVHNFKNASTTAPLKVVGFQVVKQGQVLAVPVQ